MTMIEVNDTIIDFMTENGTWTWVDECTFENSSGMRKDKDKVSSDLNIQREVLFELSKYDNPEYPDNENTTALNLFTYKLINTMSRDVSREEALLTSVPEKRAVIILQVIEVIWNDRN